MLSGEAFETALAQALRTSSSHHVQLLRDVDTLRDVLSGGVITSLMDVPWTPVFLGICFLLHPLIGIVALVGALAILAVAFINERTTKAPLIAASFKSLHALDRLTSSLRNAEAIRGLGMGSAVRSAWSATHGEALAEGAKAGQRGGTLLATSKFLRMAVQVAIMGVGAYLAIHQEISGGVLFAASLIMGRALAPVEAAVSQWRAIVSARTSYARLDEAFRTRATERRPMRLPPLAGAISVEGLTVIVPGSQLPAIAEVSFRLTPGEVVAVVGQSGSGKSSLARAMVGAWPAAQGCVRIDGNDIRHFDSNFLGQSLGYLPQDVELFAGTVRDNIARFRDGASDEEVVEAAQLASAHAMIQRLPQGYDTVIGENGAGLSGGQRQRIGLARALFGRPVFVVLDEPNANLDGDGDRALADAIQMLRKRQVTIVIINHRPNLLSLVDKIVFMHEGRIGRAGTRDELLPLLVGNTVAPMRREGRVGAERHHADGGPRYQARIPRSGAAHPCDEAVMNESKLPEMEMALQDELARLVTRSSDGAKARGVHRVVQRLVELKAQSLAWFSKACLSEGRPFDLVEWKCRKREWRPVGRLAQTCETGLWRCVPDLWFVRRLGLPGVY